MQDWVRESTNEGGGFLKLFLIQLSILSVQLFTANKKQKTLLWPVVDLLLDGPCRQ